MTHRVAWYRSKRTAVSVLSVSAIVAGGGAAATFASASPETNAKAPSVIVNGSLASPNAYGVMRRPATSHYTLPAGTRKPTADFPAGLPIAFPPDVDPSSVRELTLPADAPTGARAWAGTSLQNGLCIGYQANPSGSAGAACSGKGKFAPQLSSGPMPDGMQAAGRSSVAVGLAPDGVSSVAVKHADGSTTNVPVKDNAYFVTDTIPPTAIELNVQTTDGVTQ